MISDVETDPLLELPEVEDEHWHFIKKGGEVEAVVEGRPLITACGARLAVDPLLEVATVGGARSAQRKMCPRCLYVTR